MGTFLGGVVGSVLSFNTQGLDFVLTALLVVLFMEQMKKQDNHISGLIGIISSIVGLVVFGANNMIIPSMIIILLALIFGRKKYAINEYTDANYNFCSGTAVYMILVQAIFNT